MALKLIIHMSVFLLILINGKAGYTINETRTCEFIAPGVLKCSDTVPNNLPSGVNRVVLSSPKFPLFTFNYTWFNGDNWGNITYLEMVGDNNYNQKYNLEVDFRELKNLSELHLHLTTYYIELKKDAFIGLNRLETLNLNGCTNLYLDALTDAMSGEATLPSLQYLYISGVLPSTLYNRNSSFGFFSIIQHKRLRNLDMSNLNIAFLEIAVFNSVITLLKFDGCSLEYLNFSRTNLLHIYDLTEVCVNLTNIDISFTRAHFESISFLNLNFSRSLNLKVLNISGTLQTPVPEKEKRLKVVIEKGYVSAKAMSFFFWTNTGFILKCENQMMEVLELAENSLSFISPEFITCLENLTLINLANNKLDVMAKDFAQEFSTLFKPMVKLITINLSGNKLDSIPLTLFQFNLKLEDIDLSSNMLDHVFTSFNNLYHLKSLNLASNNIITIDYSSIKLLESLPKGFKMNINGNSIDCSKCENYDFLRWIITTTFVNKEGLKCFLFQNVTDTVMHALGSVQEKCIQQNLIRLTVDFTIAVVISILIFASTVCVAQMMWKKKQYQSKIEAIQLYIRDSNKFVVFLTYCSDDVNFVQNDVYDQLNTHLKVAIGTDRDLVCEGDRHFRVGNAIPDEISDLLDKTAVVVAVISNRYCQSVHCRNEFYQAFLKEKPIVLMLKENIELETMTGCMRDLYEKNTRILWTCKDGEFHLKTTWQNVCESIVGLIDVKCV